MSPSDGSEHRTDNDLATERRHRETIVVGLTSATTIVLVGMFGLLEIVGDVEVAEQTQDWVQGLAKATDRAMPAVGALAVLLYVWAVVAGTDAITHSLNNQPNSAETQYRTSILVFQSVFVVVGIVAGLAITTRAIVN